VETKGAFIWIRPKTIIFTSNTSMSAAFTFDYPSMKSRVLEKNFTTVYADTKPMQPDAFPDVK